MVHIRQNPLKDGYPSFVSDHGGTNVQVGATSQGAIASYRRSIVSSHTIVSDLDPLREAKLTPWRRPDLFPSPQYGETRRRLAAPCPPERSGRISAVFAKPAAHQIGRGDGPRRVAQARPGRGAKALPAEACRIAPVTGFVKCFQILPTVVP
jgi:hypothetical protein